MVEFSGSLDYAKQLAEIKSKRKIKLKDLKQVLDKAPNREKANEVYIKFYDLDKIKQNGQLGKREAKQAKDLWEQAFDLFKEIPEEAQPDKKELPKVVEADVKFSNNVPLAEIPKTEVKQAKVNKPKKESAQISARAFNDAIHTMAQAYDSNNLKTHFKPDEKSLWKVSEGDTLYGIAKKTLQAEGFKASPKAINDRIAQIVAANNIKDVNNIKIGTKLLVSLQDDTVAKLKEAGYSRSVLNAEYKPENKAGDKKVEKQEPPENKVGDNKGVEQNTPANKGGNNVETPDPAQAQEVKPVVVETPEALKGKESTITVTPNAPEREGGILVDKDGKTVEEGADGAVATKYTVDGKDVYLVVFDCVEIDFDTLEEANKFAELGNLYDLVKSAPDKETAEAKKTRLENNIKALQKLVEVSKGNKSALIIVAEDIREAEGDLDSTSNEYKSLVQNLLLTRNPDIINNLFDFDCDNGTTVFSSDPEAHKIIAGLFKEIRDTEKAGNKLSDEQIKLKDTLSKFIAVSGALVEDMGENSKLGNIEMRMDGDGNVVYSTSKMTEYFSSAEEYDNNVQARDKELLESFMQDYDKAMKAPETLSDEDKKANKEDRKTALHNLYVKYSDPKVHHNDVSFVVTMLAMSSDNLGATAEEIINVINDKNNGLDALAWFDGQFNNFDHLSDGERTEVYNTLADRALDIYTNTDKGNLENLTVLEQVFNQIDKIGLRDAEKKDKEGTLLSEEGLNQTLDAKKAKYKELILESYFEVTTKKDEHGNDVKEYKFNPSRRPTYEEAFKLDNCCENAEMAVKALVDYIKYEDMGKGQYTEAFERISRGTTCDKYSEFVKNLNTKDEIIDFIDKKISNNTTIPFDAIMEKIDSKDAEGKPLFNDEDKDVIIAELYNNADRYDQSISDENKAKLIGTQFEPKDGKISLKEGVNKNDILSKSEKWTDEKLKPYFKAILQTYGKDNLDDLAKLKDKNSVEVRSRIGELVNTNKTDNDFIQKVTNLDSALIPRETLRNIDANEVKWNDKTKQRVFETSIDFSNTKIEKRDKMLNNAVKKGLIQELKLNNETVDQHYYIGDILYDTRWYNDTNENNKFDNGDLWARPRKMTKAGYENGIAMYNEIDNNSGGGDVAKMLRSNEEPYKGFINPDDAVGIVYGFAVQSQGKGIMQSIAEEWGLGAKPGKALCNRLPKALLQKAKDMGLENTDVYKAMVDFYGATYVGKDGKTYDFKSHDEKEKYYNSKDKLKDLGNLSEAEYADKLMLDLASAILR